MPILYYHRVQPLPADFGTWTLERRRTFMEYNVLPTTFAAQLDWLVAHGYHAILPRDLAAYWDRGVRLPSRPVILTFDDGTPDWMTQVLPALRARGMVAEFYLVIETIGRSLTWGDVRTLLAAGMGVGAHDVHHVQLTELGPGRAPASPETMWAEVSGARAAIILHTGVAPDSMAYVGGGFDATLEGLVRKAGYLTARSIIRGVMQSPGRRYELRVSRIGGYDDVVDLLTGRLVPGLPTFLSRVTGANPG